MKKWLIPEHGRRKYKMSMEPFVMPECKKVLYLKRGWKILKRHWSQPKRAPNGQDLSNKINCDSIES